eukprot:CAMPEP_0118842482 /NCGR_PEP_ID=MMETSP1162-20130426/79465_1 /TAXON_ID=33656 /ORGANISM="Phaeocystis Sp, Strain CCMP2710" /LENGTH=100 /DNA_ID=CAMNT_0006774545 /DNA_START=48 /DNA_END=346 /DNA_ORIENTATION=-
MPLLCAVTKHAPTCGSHLTTVTAAPSPVSLHRLGMWPRPEAIGSRRPRRGFHSTTSPERKLTSSSSSGDASLVQCRSCEVGRARRRTASGSGLGSPAGWG